MEVTIVRGLAKLDDAWDALAAGRLFTSSRMFLESVGEGFRIEVRDGQRLVAGIPAFISDEATHAYLSPRKIFDVAPGRYLVLGSPWAFAAELLEASTGALRACSASFFGELERFVAANRLDGAFALYMNDASLALADWPSEPVRQSFDAVIDVPATFDEHMARLPRHRRRVQRSEMRKLERAGLRSAVERGDECLVELAPILAASEARFGHEVTAEDLLAWFGRQAALFGDGLRVTTVRDLDRRLIAGAIMYANADELSMRISGVDPSRAKNVFEYFHAGYYIPLRYACETGRKRLRLGMESFEAKLLRGARLEPLWAIDLLGSAKEARGNNCPDGQLAGTPDDRRSSAPPRPQ